jgi:hypothetical protein
MLWVGTEPATCFKVTCVDRRVHLLIKDRGAFSSMVELTEAT